MRDRVGWYALRVEASLRPRASMVFFLGICVRTSRVVGYGCIRHLPYFRQLPPCTADACASPTIYCLETLGVCLRTTCYAVSSIGLSLLIQYFPLTVFLLVKSANDIQWKTNIINKKIFKKTAPDLFVEIGLDGLVQRTRVIKRNLTPTWDEELLL